MRATETRIAALVDAMTLEEQVSLLSGSDFWSLPAVDRLGIGKLRVSDGPNGACSGGAFVGGAFVGGGSGRRRFRSGSRWGQPGTPVWRWNPGLAREIGVAPTPPSISSSRPTA